MRAVNIDRLDNFSGNFYEEVFKKRKLRIELRSQLFKNGGNSYNHDPEAYVVGRKDISQGVVINPNINDELTFNYNHNGKIESISIKLIPGNYSSGELVSEINSKLDEQNIDYVRAQYGGVNTGTTADDSNKLVFKNTREDNGTYVIDGVSGSSAYSIFYNASNEPTPTHTVGVVDLTEGITIEENENDTFIFDENGEKKELKFAASNYSPEEFLNEVNDKLKNANSKFIASYYDGKLKFSYDSVGYNTIDNIRGNASEDIFFNSEKREMEDVQRTFQIGANSGENITIAPIRMSTGLLGISTLTLENRKSSEKVLRSLDSAILTISQNRSKVGAYGNRMEKY